LLQQEIGSLRAVNADLAAKLSVAEKRAPMFGGPPGGAAANQEFQETSKRLKKREAECQALWDTLKDMKMAGTNTFDANVMIQLLKKRQMDTKAPRKLDLPEGAY